MTTARDVFLHDIPLDDARARFAAALAAAPPAPERIERVALTDALDRVTARTVFARLSSPHYHACAMDGIAVASAATRGARATAPLELHLERDAFVVDTGDPLPPGCDAVVMIEHVEARPPGRVAIRSAVAPFEHVRPLGEDIVASESVVPKRRRLDPVDVAALAAAGITHVDVVARPRVAVITTGDELVDPAVEHPPRGAIVDSNAVLLAALVRRDGGEVLPPVRVPDDHAQLHAAVAHAIANADVVVVNAGSSAGRDDFTAQTLGAFGEVVVHGVAIRPGHPLVLAVARTGTPLLGIPGYPVSAAICCDLFLRPLLVTLAQRDPPQEVRVELELTRKLFSPLGEEEFVRVVAARVGGRLVAAPLRRGAGVITSLSRANAIVAVPRFCEGVAAGERVTARLLRPLEAIERTLLAVGSHDIAIDLLAGALAERGRELVSANVGSIAGLVALRAGAAHVAGTHAIDPADGSYNVAAVRRYGPREPVALVHFALRAQGLMVARGNPLGLANVADVARTGARFVNRQKDAGTRMLFDRLLAAAGLAPACIVGYERLEFTHVAAAALVADGSADAALGIRAAAAALDCDFVELATEPYELALLASALEEPYAADLLAALRSPELRAQIDALPGYDAAGAGTIRIVDP
jgi:putative molybdopterin biosynthesis protein